MHRAFGLLALAAVAAGPGCAFTEPYDRPGTWRPTGAMEANIVAQLARPSDYVSGVPYAPVSTAPLSAAVARWRNDQVKPLPDSAISKIQAGTNSGVPAPGPAPTNGTGLSPAVGG